MLIRQSDVAEVVGIPGLAPGRFLKLEGDGGEAWASWGMDGDFVVEFRGDKVLRLSGVYDRTEETVDLAIPGGEGEADAFLEALRENVAGLSPIVDA